MGFAAALSAEVEKNPAWKGLNMCFVTAQSPEVGVEVEASSVDVLKDACFGVAHAGEATSTILHDPSKSLYEFLGTEQFSIIGQLARFLSGYWIRLIAMSLIKYTPPFFFSKYAFGDPRVANFIWRGRTPGGLVVVDKKGDVVLKHSETQPGDHVDWKKLTNAVAALGLK